MEIVNEDIVGFIVKAMLLTKMLERFVPESFSSIVFYAEIVKTPGAPNRHVFRTLNSGTDTCKTPIEMFEEALVDNDLVEVNKSIREYYSI